MPTIVILMLAALLYTGYTGLILRDERIRSAAIQKEVASESILIFRNASISYSLANPTALNRQLTLTDLSPYLPSGYNLTVYSNITNWQSHLINGDLFVYLPLAPNQVVPSYILDGLIQSMGTDELMGYRVDIGGSSFIRPLNLLTTSSGTMFPSPSSIPVNSFVIIGS